MAAVLACYAWQQQVFEACEDPEIEQIAVVGSRGPGKSWTARHVNVVRALQRPGTNHILFRRTSDDIVKQYAPELKALLNDFGGVGRIPHVYNQTYKTFTIMCPNGGESRIFLAFAEYAKHAEKHMSMEYATATFDEVTHFEEIIPQLIGGSVRGGSNLKKLYFGNPGGIGHCVPYGDVLTPQGWRPIQSMRENESVMTVNANGSLVATKVAQVHKHWGDHEISTVEANGFHMACTSEHKVAVVKPTGYELREFSSLPGQTTILRTLKWEGDPHPDFEPKPIGTCKWKLKQPAFITGTQYAELMGWWLSEGCVVDRDKAFSIAQRKEPQRRRIAELLGECGFHARWSDHAVTVCASDWWNYFKDFGKCRDKFIPRRLKEGSLEDLGALFSALMAGDGHRVSETSGQYYTTSERLADDVSEIAVKLGYIVRVSSRQRDNREGLEYRVDFKRTLSGGTELLTGNHVYNVSTKTKRKGKITRTIEKGWVYCLGIEDTHTFVIRQHGSVWVSGNSWCKNRFIRQETRDPKTLVLQPALKDNLELARTDPGYAARLTAGLPEWKRRQWLAGDWEASEGQYFSVPDGAIREVNPPVWAQWYAGVDWGFSPSAFAVVWIAVWRELHTGRHRCHIFADMKLHKRLDAEQAREALGVEALLPAPVKARFADPSTGKETESDGDEQTRTTARTWARNGFVTLPAKRRGRVPGWMLLRQFLTPIPGYSPDPDRPHGVLTISPECGATLAELQDATFETRGGMIVSDDLGGEDHCLVPGTVIATARGDVLIEEVRVGDRVLTRKGFRPVLKSWLTNLNAQVFTVEFSDGSSLTGTGNHPVFVLERGFIRLDALRYNDSVLTHEHYTGGAQWKKSSIRQKSFTERFSKWSFKGHGSGVTPTAWICRLGSISDLTEHRRIAVSRIFITRQCVSTAQGFVPMRAERSDGASVARTTKTEHALSAGKHTVSASISGQKRVSVAVVKVSASGNSPVYNLTVGGEPEYFANGILVHNCLDSIRYCIGMVYNMSFPESRLLPYARRTEG